MYGFPRCSYLLKNPSAKQDMWGLIPGSGRSPGEGNGSLLQYSCLENSMNRRAWQATVHRVSESDMTEAPQYIHIYVYIRIHTYMCVLSHSLMSDSLQLHELQPARLLCPWNSPGKNTAVGCHFLFQGIFPIQGSNPCLLFLQHLVGGFFTTRPPGKPIYTHMRVCVLSHFSHVQLSVTLWTVACQVPLVHAILQARTLQWVAMLSSRGSSQPRDRTCMFCVSCIAGGFLILFC